MVTPIRVKEPYLILNTVIVPIILIDILLIGATDWSQGLVVFGLVLDALGAFIIAIPEVPPLRELLYSGQLKIARRNLITQLDYGFRGTLTKGSNGFREFREILRRRAERKYDLDDSNEGQSSIFNELSKEFDDYPSVDFDEIIRFHTTTDDIGVPQIAGFAEKLPEEISVANEKYHEEWYEDNEVYAIPLRDADREVSQNISEQDGRVVVVGIGLLVIGFLNQILSYGL